MHMNDCLKLKDLSLADQAQVAEWLLTGLTWRDVQAKALKDLKIAINVEDIPGFYQAVIGPKLLDHRSRITMLARALTHQKLPGDFDDGMDCQLRQRLFELALNPELGSSGVLALVSLWLKLREQEAEYAKDTAKTTREVSGGGIPAETLARIEKQLNLM